MKATHMLAGILSGFFCYGAWVLIVLVAAAFVFGTTDFFLWGQSGRTSVVGLGLVTGFFYGMFIECGEVRIKLREALFEMFTQ